MPTTIKLDPQTKNATEALLPLVIVDRLASTAGQAQQPITLEWEKGAANSVVLEAGEAAQPVNGLADVAQWLVNSYASTGIAGSDSVQSKEASGYLQKAISLASLPFPAALEEANALDDRLALRTFLVGQTVTIADLAIWAGIRGCFPLLAIFKKGTHVHLARWFAHMEVVCKPAYDGFNEAKRAKPTAVAAAGTEEAGKKAGKASEPTQAKSFDIFLPSAKEGQVVTRFPPEPSGYLHLGHTKAAILNQYFARSYKGRLIVRFDDTNPSKEKSEFQDAIIEDLALLGIRPDQTTFTSDYFDVLYQHVVQLIKQGDAYADDTEQEEMRAQRMDGLPSKRRDLSVEDTLARFAEMTSASAEGRRWCLRAKMSVDDPNKALRDPVIYRCNPDVVHHRTGTKYKVYPTYDFACPIVDSLEGITHALRTNEYRDRNPQYAWFLQKLNLRNVEIWDFGRLNFQYTLLSKRKLTWFVENGKVTGWDDPRFPTVRGIRRRGMTIEALQQFILATGPSQQIINMEWDQIWTLNKRIIDPIVPRFTAVDEAGKVKCTIEGAGPAHEKAVPKHKKNLEIGNKTTVYDSTIWVEQEDAKSFADNEEITLMDWGNVFVRSMEFDPATGAVKSLKLEAHFDGDFKKTKKKVHWLADSATRPLIPVTLLDFDYLITKPKLEEEDKFEDFVTPQTIFSTQALADANVAEQLKEGDRMQFERKGYYILDKINGESGKREFVKIPDGKVEASRSKAATAAAAAADGGKSAAAGEVEERKRKAKAEREAKKAKGALAAAAGAGSKKEGKKASKEAAAAVVASRDSKEEAKEVRKENKAAAKEGKQPDAGSFPELVDGGAAGKTNMYSMRPIVGDLQQEDGGNKVSGMYSMRSIHQ